MLPELSTVNLVTPEAEALINGEAAPPVWFIVKADWPDWEASIEKLSSTSTEPTAEAILLLSDVLVNGFVRSILPKPSGAI